MDGKNVKIAEVRRLSGLESGDEKHFKMPAASLGFDDVAINPATFERPPLDQWVDDIETNVAIGEGRDVELPLEVKSPLVITTPGRGMISPELRRGLLLGAAKARIPVMGGTGGLTSEELKLIEDAGCRLIVEMGPMRLGMNAEIFKKAAAFLIKPTVDETFRNRCAKAMDTETLKGWGVKDEKMEVMVPPFSLDMGDGDGLETFIQLLRDISDSRVPVIVDIGMGGLYNGAVKAIEAGADAVCVSQDPFSMRKLPILGAYPQVLRAFRDTDAVRNGVKLIVTGDFMDSEDIYKGLSMGADLVGLCAGPLISAGCDVESEDGCVWIDASDKGGEWKSEKDVEERIATYTEELNAGLRRLMASGGDDDVSTLRPDNLRATTQNAASASGLKMQGYEKTLAMWLH